jgi:hypothetical protein
MNANRERSGDVLYRRGKACIPDVAIFTRWAAVQVVICSNVLYARGYQPNP